MPGFGSLSPADDDLSPQRPSWMMGPDLLSSQMGTLPTGVARVRNPYPPGSEEADWFDRQPSPPVSSATGEPLTVVRRPSVLPIARTPEGLQLVKPKVLDLATYAMGNPAAAEGSLVSQLSGAKRVGDLAADAGEVARQQAEGVPKRRPAALSIKGASEAEPEEAPVPATAQTPPSGAPKPAQTPSGEPDWSRMNQPFGSVTDPIVAGKGRAAIRQSDIDRGMGLAMGFSGGGLATKGIELPPAKSLIVPRRLYTPTAGASGIINAGVDAPVNPAIQTVRDPYRMMFPGIYGNPRLIAAEAAARVGPEDPAMKRLFGVTRADLWDMAQDRRGNMPPPVPEAGPRAKGAESARRIMTPENTQRMLDILGEAGRHEGLRNADAWYIMDPVYERQAQMFGPAQAIPRYSHFNTMTGMASPGSDVMTEIQRGTAAHWLEQQGRFEDFMRYAGVPEEQRGAAYFPEDMMYIGGHPYHGTAQALPMSKYLAAGRRIQSEAPKVPLYTSASGVPETGFQTTGPVGDAHWSRGVGLTDVRKGPTDVQGSFSMPEYRTAQPWWQHQVAEPAGLESVPAQARLWTALGPQTGVESELGAPKLELLSRQIMTAADRLGVSPETARDLVLSGKAGAGLLAAGVLGAGTFGSLRPPSAEERQ